MKSLLISRRIIQRPPRSSESDCSTGQKFSNPFLGWVGRLTAGEEANLGGGADSYILPLPRWARRNSDQTTLRRFARQRRADRL